MNKKYRLRKVIERHTPSPHLAAFHIELFDCGTPSENDWTIERKRLPIGRMKYHREGKIQRQFRSATNIPLFTPASEAFLRDLETAPTPVVEGDADAEENSICLDDLSLDNGTENQKLVKAAGPEIIISEPEQSDTHTGDMDNACEDDDFFGEGDIDPNAGEKEVHDACIKSDSFLKSTTDSSDTSSDDDEFESADKETVSEDNNASCVPKFGGGFDPLQERTISIPTSAANTHNSDSTDAEDSVATIKDAVSIDAKDPASENPVIANTTITEEETTSPISKQPINEESPCPEIASASNPDETKSPIQSAPLPTVKEDAKSVVAGSDPPASSQPPNPKVPSEEQSTVAEPVSVPDETVAGSNESPSSPKGVHFATETVS